MSVLSNKTCGTWRRSSRPITRPPITGSDDRVESAICWG
jgi:hypothetical protein